MPRQPLRCTSFLVLALAGLLPGCEQRPPQAAAEAAVVTVSQPLERAVTDSATFTGTTDAVESVEIRARVSGYLQKVAFEAGDEVKKGQLLFGIEPTVYAAQLDQAKGAAARDEATLGRLEAEYNRSRRLLGTGTVSREDFDKSLAQRDEMKATIASDKASVKVAQQSLDWTRVVAPIGGKISRNLLTVGNLIKADDTLLTTIVSQDPMYAYFDVDEHTLLDIKALLRAGKLKDYKQAKVAVSLGMANETGFPHRGYIDYVNNKVTSGTGTINVRGLFPNTDRALTPGLFVRIRVQIGLPYKALLVSERTLGTEQGQKYLLVVGADNKVVRRDVRVGTLQDGLRVIAEGLRPDDWVIVDGLQRVRPGVPVAPERQPMPEGPSVGAVAAAEVRPADGKSSKH